MKYLLKKDLNTLNKIKSAGITKQKRRTLKRKKLLDLLNDLPDTIFTNKTPELKSQKDENENANENENKNVNENENENENENVNENDKTLMSSNENDDETMSQNKIIKELNDHN